MYFDRWSRIAKAKSHFYLYLLIRKIEILVDKRESEKDDDLFVYFLSLSTFSRRIREYRPFQGLNLF